MSEENSNGDYWFFWNIQDIFYHNIAKVYEREKFKIQILNFQIQIFKSTFSFECYVLSES